MGEPHTFLLARAGARRFAFRLQDLAAVLPLPRLTRAPGAVPPPLLGFADVGGRATPVLAPATLLGDAMPGELALDTHLLLMKTSPALALAVDRATDILSVPGSSIRSVAPEDSANGWLAGEIGDGEDTHALVRTDRLLLDAERVRLANLAEVVARRMSDAAA